MPPGPVTITFDWTITVGSILGALGVIGSVVGALWSFYTKIDRCIHRIENKADQMHAENKMSIRVIESRVTDMWEAFMDRR